MWFLFYRVLKTRQYKTKALIRVCLFICLVCLIYITNFVPFSQSLREFPLEFFAVKHLDIQCKDSRDVSMFIIKVVINVFTALTWLMLTNHRRYIKINVKQF